MSNVTQLPDRASGFVPRRLTEARIARRMTRVDLARSAGITGQAVGYYEGGDRRPDMRILLKFSEALGCSPGLFLHEGPEYGSGLGTRFFRATGHRSNRLNESLDVRLKWLWEIVSYVAKLVKLPNQNLPEPSLSSNNGYHFIEIEHIAMQTRRFWGLGDGPIANMVALLETHGVVVSRFSMGSEKIDAFSCWLSGRPYIVLGSGKQSGSRSRFDAAHELGHLIMHRDISQEDVESKNILDRIEREANQFAGAFLLPRKPMINEFYSTRLNHLKGLKQRWRVSMQAIAHRAMQLGLLDDDQYIAFRKQMSAQKWLTMEPLDDIILIEQPGFLKKAWALVAQCGAALSLSETELGLGPELLEEVTGFAAQVTVPVQAPLLKSV